jgi:hypothetical protein
LRGAACERIIALMRLFPRIRRSFSLSLGLGLALAAAGCSDNPASSGFEDLDVRLVQPLTLIWNGKDQGAPIVSGGTFRARATARVEWRFELTAVPADPDDPRFNYAQSLEEPRFVKTATFQDGIQFAWNPGMTGATRWAFALGDTCTAKVTATPKLADSETQNAIFRFVLGGGELPDE